MKKEFEHTIGLKIATSEVSAKALYCIRNLTDLPLSEIKQRIANHEYLLIIDAAELEDLKLINKLNREVSKYGIKCTVYLNDEIETTEFIENFEKTCIEISEQ